MKPHLIILFLYCSAFSQFSYSAQPPPLIKPEIQLASQYQQNISVSDYLISEKYDGVRAVWTGAKLLTRSGNEIHAPDWFTAPLPNIRLDGELWSARGEFEFISATVKKQRDKTGWQKLKYMVFDAPDKHLPFAQRYQNYQRIIMQIHMKTHVEHIQAVEQFELADHQQLSKKLQVYVAKGAEGLMLHHKQAKFDSGRGLHLVKLKPYMDAEATVIALLPGKGKYKGKMGALLVKNQQDISFRIGTGFTDSERENPPKIGDIITYRYHGFTKNGKPKFASYLRIRTSVTKSN